MKRNIITTIEFKHYQVAINVLEKVNDSNIEIFNASDQIYNINLFIKDCLKKINNMINGKVQDVFIIIEPSKKNDIKMRIVDDQIKIFGKYIVKKDIDNLIVSMKKKYEKKGQKIVLVHPIKFVTKYIDKKVYKYAPLNILANYLSMKAMITSINLETYVFIKNIIKLHKLKIIQFFSMPQTISNFYLSKNAIYNGAVLLHFENKKIIFIYNKMGITKNYFYLYNWGFEKLIKNVMKEFNCSDQDAYNLILIYGSLKKPTSKEIIYTNWEGIKEIDYSNLSLHRIIKNYFTKIISIFNNHINQQNLKKLLFVISGKVVKINYVLDFFQYFLSKNVVLHSVVEYLETNTKNTNVLGVLRIKDILNDLISKNLNTTISTNPNSFEHLSKNCRKNKNIINKIISKFWGEYDWNI